MPLRDVLWEPKKGPLAFVTMGFLLSVSTNLLSNIVQEKSWTWWFLVVGVPLGVLALILSPLFSRLFPAPGREPVSTLIRPAGRYKILVGVASMGAGISSMKDAILFHCPEKVYLVHSEGSKPHAESLKETFITGIAKDGGQVKISPENFDLLPISNAGFDDPEQVRELVERKVYGALPLGFDEDDVMIDITGGSKGATAGALLAGLSESRNLEIVLTDKRNESGYAVGAGVPVEIDISYKLKKVKKS